MSERAEGVVTAFDAIAVDLQRLRADAGLPSYADIVVRIAQERAARGVAEAATRPARTTVYDAFRLGRRRLDPTLVGEIVRALGVPEEESHAWEERVRTSRADAATPPPVLALAVTRPEVGLVADAAEAVDPQPGPAEAPAALTALPVRPARRPLTPRLVVGVLLGSIALNLGGRLLVDYLGLSIYLDMVGTAVSAVVLGPWWGVLVAAVTNITGVATSGPTSLPFGLVNATGALVWGYGIRRWGFGRSIPRFFALGLIVGVACSLVAAPIIVALGGESHHRSDNMVEQVQAVFDVFMASVLAINLAMSTIDKAISGVVALVVAELLRRPIESAEDDRRRRPID